MKRISVDNGMHYVEPAEALAKISLAVMAEYMDDDTREAVHLNGYRRLPRMPLEAKK